MASWPDLDLGAGWAWGLRSGHQRAVDSNPDPAPSGLPHQRQGLIIRAEFDFRQTGPQTWDIRIETQDGQLVLSSGGAKLFLDGRTLLDAKEAEYSGIYRHFVELVGRGASDVDLAPLAHVADAFMLGQREIVEAFEH